MGVLTILAYVLSFLLIWQFVAYPLLMGLLARKARFTRMETDDTIQPFISIIIPTYNEQQVIGKRIENCFTLNYPFHLFELIVVDSGSNDKTADIVRDFISKQDPSMPKVTLIVEKARNGKASAINLGKSGAAGDIVLVTDANSLFDRDVLKRIAPHFKDSKVGGVGGQFCVANRDQPLAESTQFYWDLEYIMRLGESVLDSACLFHGEINAWRKELVNADSGMISDDLDIALQIKQKGYRLVYEPNAMVFEPAPTTVQEQITQRKRTAIGTLQATFKYWRFLAFPGDFYRTLIFPSHKILVFLSPFLLMAIPVLYLLIWDLNVILFHALFSIILFTFIFIELLRVRSELRGKDASSPFSIQRIPQIFYYVMINEYLVLLAWKDYIFGNYSVLWKKAESTRT